MGCKLKFETSITSFYNILNTTSSKIFYLVHKNMLYGRVIGKKGATIRELQTKTGTYIQMPKVLTHNITYSILDYNITF